MKRIGSIVRDAVILTRLFTKSLRFWGPFTFVLSIGFPLLLFGFLRLNLGPVDQSRMLYLLSGTFLVGFVNLSVTSLAQYIVNLKVSQGLEAFRSLPIRGVSLVFGIVGYYLIINVPVFCAFVALLPIHGFTQFANVFFFLAIALCVTTLIPLGAFIGMYAKGVEQGSVLSIAIGFFLYMAAPVYFPLEHLPLFFRKLSSALPTTYLADALRQSISGQVNAGRFTVDVAVALAFALALYALMFRKFRMISD
ncbi:MAG: ABC transporter permease [Candidatus Bipolaricaulia bacterium]